MVAAGFSGVDDVFSGPRNFFDAFGGDPAILARDLGTTFEIMHCAIKKWSVGSPIQAPLDSLEALMRSHNLSAEQIASIEVHVSDKEAHIVDSRSMPDICLQHLLAVLLLDGRLTFRSSHDYSRMADESVLAQRRKITLVHDPDLPRREGAVRVVTTTGQQFDHHTRFVRGTAGNPMTREEVAAKTLDLTAQIIGEPRAKELIARIWAVETLDDVRALRPLLTA
jgi:2-methylcitrate dehydratase PrpD